MRLARDNCERLIGWLLVYRGIWHAFRVRKDSKFCDLFYHSTVSKLHLDQVKTSKVDSPIARCVFMRRQTWIIIIIIKTLFQEGNTVRTQLISLAALQYLQVYTNTYGNANTTHTYTHTQCTETHDINLSSILYILKDKTQRFWPFLLLWSSNSKPQNQKKTYCSCIILSLA